MRKLLFSNNMSCPRCKFNDKTDPIFDGKIGNNVRNWFRRETTYTSEQIQKANSKCDRCNIMFICEGRQ